MNSDDIFGVFTPVAFVFLIVVILTVLGGMGVLVYLINDRRKNRHISYSHNVRLTKDLEEQTEPQKEHGFVGVQPVVRCIEDRLVNIMVEKHDCGYKPFFPQVVVALREYVDAMEKFNSSPIEVENSSNKNKTLGHDMHRFQASNGCDVKVIAGAFTQPATP